MQNPSRRAFFGGKAPELPLWDQFLLELQRKTQGSIRTLGPNVKQALCTAQLSTDIHHARQLCQTFGVKLYVGSELTTEDLLLAPTLGLDLSCLNQLQPVDDKKNQWFIQSGVTVAQLREVGFAIPAEIPETLWMAQWLGTAHYQSYALQHLKQSGLVHASLLMADGTVGSLGPFGVENTKPLNTATLRRVVPQLFQLANSELAQQLPLAHWPATYRLDIFNAANPSLNLAHLLLGAGQGLGLLEWVVMDLTHWQAAPLVSTPSQVDTDTLIYAQELDAAVKKVFDPDALFITLAGS